MKLNKANSQSIIGAFYILRATFSRYNSFTWAPALATFILIGILAFALPSYYVSDVKIFIEPQKISSKIVEAAEKEEQFERLEALIEEVLSRPRLRSVLDRFDLYPEYQGVVNREIALEKFRKDIQVKPLVSRLGKTLTQTFLLVYSHQDPRKAYDVTREISNLFIEESVISQRNEVQGTEEFLESQLRDARKRLEQTESQVQEFVRNNVGKLPEDREQALARLSNAQSQLSVNSQLIAANVARINYLQNEYRLTAKETSGVNTGELKSDLDAEIALSQLEKTLETLRSRYSEKHPDVINTQRRIQTLKQRIGSGENLRKGGAKGNIETRSLRREIGELEVQTERLRTENTKLKDSIEQITNDIKAMPLKEQELVRINRDYANVKENYQMLLAAREKADIQSSLVKSQKKSSFKIIDPPSMPVRPAGPYRFLIVLLGVVFGGFVYVSVSLTFFFLSSAYKFKEEPEDDLGVSVIGVVPPMKTPFALRADRKACMILAAYSLLFTIIGGALIIYFV